MAEDPYEQLEEEANAFLYNSGDSEAKPLIDKLRKQLSGVAKREKTAFERGKAEAQAEVKAQAERAKVFEQFGIPKALEPMFTGVDLSDSAAVATQVKSLADLGLKVGQPAAQAQQQPNPQEQSPAAQPGQQQQSAQAQPYGVQPYGQAPGAPADPGLIVSAFQQAQAAGVPGQAGDVLSRVAQGGAGALKDANDVASFEQQLNAAVHAAGQRPGAGVMG